MHNVNITSLPVQHKPPELASAAVVSLTALAGNVKAIARHCGPGVRIMAVVKADAYGHGGPRVAAAALAAGAHSLAVATVEEGIALRKAGVDSPVLVLGLLRKASIPLLVEYALTPSICSLEDAADIAAHCADLGRRTPVHLRVDIAGGGIGAPASQAVAIGTAAANMSGVLLEGVYCHLASSYKPDLADARVDAAAFRLIVMELAALGVDVPYVHAASSPGIIALPEAHFNMVRAGIMLYGLPVMDGAPAFPCAPVMAIKSSITGFKSVGAGDRYGYGGRFTSQHTARLAIVPMGYADAPFLFHLRGGDVIIRGRRAPLVGQMYMDHCFADVTGIVEAEAGDEVVLLGGQMGESIGADELAVKAGIGHLNADCVCLLGSRMARVYAGEA